MKKWNIGQPGGINGPFYSIIAEDGQIIALQVPDEKIAKLLASVPDLLSNIEELKQYKTMVQAQAFGKPILFDGENVVGILPTQKKVQK